MNIVEYILDNYFKIMKSINVRSVSIAIIVLIILIEFIELFINPEDTENSEIKHVKNKQEKSNFLKKIVNINRNPQIKEPKITFEKDKDNNYFISEQREQSEEKIIPISEESEILGSKIIEINTVIDGNRIYMEKKEKIIQN